MGGARLGGARRGTARLAMAVPGGAGQGVLLAGHGWATARRGMVICEISRCTRPAVVAILFIHSTEAHYMCSFHSYDKRGRLRWDPRQINNLERLR